MVPFTARRSLVCGAVVVFVLTGTSSGGAASVQGAPAHDFQTYRPSLAATRITAAEAPNIDGDISDPVWRKAPALDEFYQLEPREGAPASERTIVHVLYDDKNLYFSFMVFDDEPQKITAHIKARDGSIDQDDFVRILLDPYKTRRNGYVFEVNALGARREGLVQNNSDFLYEWNTFWNAKVRMLPNGWSAEIVIPFRSISYDKATTDWGFDLMRIVRRKNERIRWSGISEIIQSPDISRAGTLTGVTGIDQGLGLDVQAYSAIRYQRDWDDSGHSGFQFRPSGSAFYKITPSLTGTLTTYTDFSDTPLDQRQVNIGRFGLFFPETRDFFLQDAAAFEFGGLLLHDDPNGRPFFSRNVGLINGSQPVDLLAGVKLSGNYEGFDIGALSVRTGGTRTTEGQFLSVARVSTPVLGTSKIGFIVSNGDPTGATRNSVAGADFQFRDPTLIPGKEVEADAYFQRSFSSKVGDDNAFGFDLNFPNEPWGGVFKFKNIGENFDPALGFVSRPGIREYNGNVTRRTRPVDSFARFYETGVWYDVVTGLNNLTQSSQEGSWVAAMTQRGEFGMIETWNDYEKIPVAFALPKGVIVPAANYDWQVFHGRFSTATDRIVSGTFDIQCCGFYGGHLLQTDTTLNLHPDDTLTFTGRHIMQNIGLPTGHVAIHIGSLDAALNFTPDMQIRMEAQYDNISQDLGYSVKYRWEFDPGSELLVVVGDDATVNSFGRYESHLSQFSVRIGHLFRA
jgi:hypothetical protein